MAARFTPAPGLDAIVAARFAAPEVDRVAEAVQDEARRRAPEAKVWVTMEDERVRHSHVAVDHVEIPANLRYVLPLPGQSDTTLGHEMAREPRDPDLSIGNEINCRCQSLPLPDALRRSIHRSHATVVGTRAHARVSTDYDRVVESEFPGPGDSGGGWLREAVAEVAARTAARSRPPR